MKQIAFVLAALSALVLNAQLAAQPEQLPASVSAIRASIVRIPVRPDSRLWLEGSSNVRDWTCKATVMEATIDLDNATIASDDRLVRAVSVRVPVRMLKCGDRQMEAQMYTALKAPSLPEVGHITAWFDRIPRTAIPGELIETAGQLTVAGVERTVKITVRSERLSDGSYRARGTVPILMTDFGIKPPRPWGGILRTANKVLIQFEIFIAPVT